MVRAIRNLHYEETKQMTREEKRGYDEKRINRNVAEFKALTANAKTDEIRFPFLAGK